VIPCSAQRFDHGILGKTAFQKLLMVKIELPESGHIWNPPLLKMHALLDFKHVHIAWVAGTAIFFSS